MNITITINQEDMKNPEIINAAQALIAQFTKPAFLTPEVAKTATKETKKTEKVTETATIADRDRYYLHPESDSYFTVKKGEAYPTGMDFDLSHEVTKAEFEKGNDLPQPQTITLQQLRAAATAMAQAKGAPAVKELLARFDAPSVTALKEEHYAALWTAMEAS